MNFSTASSERITAIVSTVVAVVILAGGVSAYQSHHAQVEDLVQLESDLRFQLEVAFRHDPNERARRLVQLTKVSQAWKQSPRQAAEHEKLSAWLLEATIRSMPGSIQALPAVPNFNEPAQQPKTALTPDTPFEASAGYDFARKALESPAVAPTLDSPVPSKMFRSADFNAPTPRTTPQAATLDGGQISSADRESVEAVVKPQSIALLTQAESPVQINLTELTARIAGYHYGLQEVETRLHTLDVNDLEAVAEQIRQLDEIARDFRFVKMYYDTLTEQERRAISAPRSIATTLAEIERRLDRNQATLSGDYLEEFDSLQPEPIAELRQQLADIVNRVDW